MQTCRQLLSRKWKQGSVSEHSPQYPLREIHSDASCSSVCRTGSPRSAMGEREHQHGIKIESCDNPGWWVKIDLAGTKLETRDFTPVLENADAADFQLGPRWICCRVGDVIWHGAGDETRLPQILELFLNWAESGENSPL